LAGRPARDNVLATILCCGSFEAARCSPARIQILAADGENDLHIEMLFRTIDRRLYRPENSKLLERHEPFRLHFDGYDVLSDRRTLGDNCGIGRVNR